MRQKSVIIGLVAWVCLLCQLLGLDAPVWLGPLTLYGLFVAMVTSLVLSIIEKNRIGFWLGATAMLVFLVIVVFAVL